jgi:hypothetical protein
MSMRRLAPVRRGGTMTSAGRSREGVMKEGTGVRRAGRIRRGKHTAPRSWLRAPVRGFEEENSFLILLTPMNGG